MPFSLTSSGWDARAENHTKSKALRNLLITLLTLSKSGAMSEISLTFTCAGTHSEVLCRRCIQLDIRSTLRNYF